MREYGEMPRGLDSGLVSPLKSGGSIVLDLSHPKWPRKLVQWGHCHWHVEHQIVQLVHRTGCPVPGVGPLQPLYSGCCSYCCCCSLCPCAQVWDRYIEPVRPKVLTANDAVSIPGNFRLDGGRWPLSVTKTHKEGSPPLHTLHRKCLDAGEQIVAIYIG